MSDVAPYHELESQFFGSIFENVGILRSRFSAQLSTKSDRKIENAMADRAETVKSEFYATK